MRETFNEINITPLTDIFLVLLIIMMVIAPLLDKQGISLTVPENVEQSKIEKEPQILTVVVTQNNKYLINNEEVSPDRLGTVFSVKGGYTKEKQKMLMCVVPTREYYRLKEGISKIDKDSFFVITDSYEVKGGA